MGLPISRTKLTIALAVSFCLTGLVLSRSPVVAETDQKFVIKPIAEKKLAQLPAGPLYWRVETYPTVSQAKAAEGPASLATEVAGRAWLLTLGGQGLALDTWRAGRIDCRRHQGCRDRPGSPPAQCARVSLAH